MNPRGHDTFVSTEVGRILSNFVSLSRQTVCVDIILQRTYVLCLFNPLVIEHVRAAWALASAKAPIPISWYSCTRQAFHQLLHFLNENVGCVVSVAELYITASVFSNSRFYRCPDLPQHLELIYQFLPI